MKNYFLFLLFCVGLSKNSIAQCPFDSIIQNNLKTNTELKHNWTTANEIINRKTPNLLRGVIVIPVVVHVVWRTPEENISDAQIHSQISILNRDFNAWNRDLDNVPTEFKPFINSESGIRFFLITLDTTGKPTTGIVRKQTKITEIGLRDSLFATETGGSTAWQPQNILNIWVANTSDKITGIGSFPMQNPINKDGIVIHPRYFGRNATSKFGLGRVAVHEAGHYFGLQHLWGVRTDSTTCGSDDIADTPPQKGAYRGCPTPPQYSCGQSNMFMNFMDYTDDPCLVFFTKGQMARMINTIQTLRKGFLSNVFVNNKPTESDNLFSVNPSLVFNHLILKNNSVLNNYQIVIHDLLGRSCLNKNITTNEKETLLEISDLQKGFYIFSVIDNNKIIYSQKIIKI